MILPLDTFWKYLALSALLLDVYPITSTPECIDDNLFINLDCKEDNDLKIRIIRYFLHCLPLLGYFLVCLHLQELCILLDHPYVRIHYRF